MVGGSSVKKKKPKINNRKISELFALSFYVIIVNKMAMVDYLYLLKS